MPVVAGAHALSADGKGAPAFWHVRAVSTQRYAQAGWNLEVVRDRFTSQVRCSLTSSGGRIQYQPNALGFRFSHRLNTLNAWYRIDTGEVRPWRDLAPRLIALQLPIDKVESKNAVPWAGAIKAVDAVAASGAHQRTIVQPPVSPNPVMAEPINAVPAELPLATQSPIVPIPGTVGRPVAQAGRR
jgi:hypothetical protein